jgi:thioredoxin-related protein
LQKNYLVFNFNKNKIMKKLLAPIAVITALLLLSFISVDPLPIGSTLPKQDKKLKDVSGKETSLKEARDKNGLLVMFSCNTCPYVIKNQQRTKAICSYAQKNGLGVVVINSNEGNRGNEESFEAMKTYASKQHYQWKYLVDSESELANAFGANRTPECYLFDKDLKLVYHGAIDNNPSDEDNVSRKHLQIAIDEAVSGKDVSVKETKSVGCGIKRKS